MVLFKDARAGTLAQQFCSRWVSVCIVNSSMNQIIINSIKYTMCHIHIDDNYSEFYPDSL